MLKKVFLSTAVFLVTVTVIGNAVSAFTDEVKVKNNKFQTGNLDMQISKVGGVTATDWADETSDAWVSPDNWAPGDTLSKVVYLRNHGTVDIKSVKFSMSNITNSNTTNPLDEKVNLTEAWYDRDGNTINDAGDDILADLKNSYDSNSDGILSLKELESADFELESGDTNSLTNGLTDGKGLHMTWEFDKDADNNYQNSTVSADFNFNASNLE